MSGRSTTRLARVESRLRALDGGAALPAEDVVVKSLPAVRVAELTSTAAGYDPAEIGPVIQPLYRDLSDRLRRAGLESIGPAIAYYEDFPADDDMVIVHATVPIAAGEAGTTGRGGGFAIVDLPAVPAAATMVHRGSMDDVLASFQALARWIDVHGHRRAGCARELYIAYDQDHPDRGVTELQEPIASPSA